MEKAKWPWSFHQSSSTASCVVLRRCKAWRFVGCKGVSRYLNDDGDGSLVFMLFCSGERYFQPKKKTLSCTMVSQTPDV